MLFVMNFSMFFAASVFAPKVNENLSFGLKWRINHFFLATIGCSCIIIERKVQISSSLAQNLSSGIFFQSVFPCVSTIFGEFFFYSVGKRQGENWWFLFWRTWIFFFYSINVFHSGLYYVLSGNFKATLSMNNKFCANFKETHMTSKCSHWVLQLRWCKEKKLTRHVFRNLSSKFHF